MAIFSNPMITRITKHVCLPGILMILFFTQQPLKADEFSFQKLSAGWKYCWGGDSIPQKESWKDAPSVTQAAKQKKDKVLWLKTSLPSKTYSDPVIFVSYVDLVFETYLNNKLIYQYGSINNMLSSFSIHFISLPPGYEGKEVVFKISSSLDTIGFSTDEINFGNRSAIYKWILQTNMDKIFLGILYIIIGLATIILFFSKFKEFSFLSFSLFVISMGFYTISRTNIKQLLMGNNDIFWGSIELMSLYCVPFLLNLFIKEILKPSKINPFYWLWIPSGFFAISAISFGLAFPNSLMVTLPHFKIGLLIEGAFVFIYLPYAVIKGKQDAGLFLLGMLLFAVFATFDVLQELRILPKTIFVSHWGMVLLIICFTYILAQRVAQMYRNLTNYSQELEQKNYMLHEAHENMESLYSEIELTQKEVIFRLSEVAEARSKETGNHVRRVASYCQVLAEEFGLTEKEIQILKLAAPMHDIGKLGIPDSILNKPKKLTEREFEIIKSHTVIGYEMLNKSSREIFSAASIVAYEHHEKFNGEGYPRKLSGKDIHIFGRITAVADVFDSLASDRVYKKAWNLDRILELLDQEMGHHFDPDLVRVLFKNIDKFIHIRDQFKDSLNF